MLENKDREMSLVEPKATFALAAIDGTTPVVQKF